MIIKFSKRAAPISSVYSMPRTSFGLIPICKATGRTLLVQNKDSPDFLHLIRGFYRRSNIPYILKHSNRKEHEILREICTCPEILRSIKIQKCLESRYPANRIHRYLSTAIRRINEDILIIGEELKSVIPKEECDWVWPKGGQNRNETELECAIRETEEEAGITVPRGVILDSDPLTVEIKTFFGSTFRTCYYIANLKEEIKSKGFDTSEIANVEWVSIEEAKRRTNTLYGSLIKKILPYIQ